MRGRRASIALLLLFALVSCSKGSPPHEVKVSCPSVDCSLVGGRVSCNAKTDPGRIFVADGTELQVEQRVPIPATVADLLLSPVCKQACVVTGSRTVYCWGDVMEGDPDQRRHVYPPAVVEGLTNVRNLAMTGGSVCALRADGSVWCSGTLLGISAKPGVMAAIQIPVPTATAIAADFIQTCVLGADGVRCWGGHRPSHGRQLRLDGITLFEGTEDASQLRAEDGMMCAVYPDRREDCWSTTAIPLGTSAAP